MTIKRPVAALRVAQLDTVELDSSAIRLLSTQLQACFKHKLNGYDLMQVEPHLRTVMYVLFLYSTLWKNGQTIGQKLLRLRYGVNNNLDTPSKRRLLFVHGMLAVKFWFDASRTIGRPWFLKNDFMLRFTKLLEASYDFLSLCNFLLFLRQGHFHTLLLRLVGLRSVYVDPNPLKRNISFHIMSREILWQGFAETGVFFFSLVNFSKLRRKYSEFLFNHVKSDKEEVFDSCGFCKQIPVMPYLGACKIHAYCYYCVSTALQKDEGLKCPLCAVVIEAISPLHCSSITLS